MSDYVLNGTVSVYGLTLLQKKLCEPLLEQYDLSNGYLATPEKAPDRPDWRQSEYYKKYTDWCHAHGKPIGSEPPALSTFKWVSIGTVCIILQPLKHLIGCVESVVRIPFSILTHLAEYVMNVKSFNRHLGTPLSNLRQAVGEVAMTVLMTVASLNKVRYFYPTPDKYKQLYDNFVHELKTATGDQLWQWYS